ncbi:MAG: hypothetical protein U0Z26_00220 [Anaerolineales bacterium]
MKINRFVILTFLTLLTLIPISNASAHHPIWGDEAITAIDNLNTSFAFYRNLPADTVHFYTFMGKKGQNLHAGINIPAVKGLENYSVSMALFGPTLPEVDHEQLPPEHPEDLGAIIFPSKVSANFFESFTQTLYWGRQSIEMTLPADGEYYLVIWQPEGIAGKYVMDSGRDEVFGFSDIFRFPIWWIQVHIFFGHGPYLLAGAVVILGLISYSFMKRRKTK